MYTFNGGAKGRLATQKRRFATINGRKKFFPRRQSLPAPLFNTGFLVPLSTRKKGRVCRPSFRGGAKGRLATPKRRFATINGRKKFSPRGQSLPAPLFNTGFLVPLSTRKKGRVCRPSFRGGQKVIYVEPNGGLPYFFAFQLSLAYKQKCLTTVKKCDIINSTIKSA